MQNALKRITCATANHLQWSQHDKSKTSCCCLYSVWLQRRAPLCITKLRSMLITTFNRMSRFAVTPAQTTGEQRRHRGYCISTAAAQMTKRINHTARKLRLINYPWINKSLQGETGAVNWVSPKDPLLSPSLSLTLTPSPFCLPIQPPEFVGGGWETRAVKVNTAYCQAVRQAVLPVGSLRAQVSCFP